MQDRIYTSVAIEKPNSTINQDQTSMSMFLPPMEEPNLGKLRVSLYSLADNLSHAPSSKP
jgi:hypothetical protein